MRFVIFHCDISIEKLKNEKKKIIRKRSIYIKKTHNRALSAQLLREVIKSVEEAFQHRYDETPPPPKKNEKKNEESSSFKLEAFLQT